MQQPQGCPPALYDIMLECWHKVGHHTEHQRPQRSQYLISGPDEETDIRDPSVEAGGLLHDVRLGVQGSLSILTLVCVSELRHRDTHTYRYTLTGDWEHRQ